MSGTVDPHLESQEATAALEPEDNNGSLPEDPSVVVSVNSTPVAVPGSRAVLDREMREIKDNVLRMGSIVADQIRASLTALVTHDEEAAVAVIVADRQVNEVQRHVASQPRRRSRAICDSCWPWTT